MMLKQFCIFVFAIAALLATGNEASADFYKWGLSGRCDVYTDNGVYRGEVEDVYCGNDYVAWSPTGKCIRHAGNGRIKDQVEDKRCKDELRSLLSIARPRMGKPSQYEQQKINEAISKLIVMGLNTNKSDNGGSTVKVQVKAAN